MTELSEHERAARQVLAVVKRIPRGKVLSYGEIGALCEPPLSGYIAGRHLRNPAQPVPWWRVVSKDGSLPVAKRNPAYAEEQRSLLAKEGVAFDEDGRVVMDKYRAKLKMVPLATSND